MSVAMENAIRVAQYSLASARKCLEAENYGRAFAHFLLFLKLAPDRHKEVYLEFSLATREWCESLEHSDRIVDLFQCYDQACELFPNHDTVLNNIGAQLFRLGYIEEAAAYIRRSLLVNPDYLAAHDNLENICSHLVERWHFSMLNDKRRNIAYKFAIEKAIKCGYDTVLDIGTGTGILSLMCESSGAQTISACDSSRAMIEVARDVLAANSVSHRVTLIHKPSEALSIPQDLPQKVKLVVTEIFDAGLFGEHAVSTLIHAWKNLISTSPMGTVVPCGATMYVCGIECESIRQQNRMMYPVLQYVDISQVDLHSTTGHVAEEPYTTENLAKVDKGYKILTNISELLRVNFCNLFELESLDKGKDWTCDLHVKQNGHVDALAVWFDLHLDDSVTIATGADDKSCWEQAIYPVITLLSKEDGGRDSCQVRKKETLQTVFHFEQDCLRLVNCEIMTVKKSTEGPDPSSKESCDCLKNTGSDCHSNSGTALKECQEHVLPFRKRKVESAMCRDTDKSMDTEGHAETAHAGKTDFCDSMREVSIQSYTCEVPPEVMLDQKTDTKQSEKCSKNHTDLEVVDQCMCETDSLEKDVSPYRHVIEDVKDKEIGKISDEWNTSKQFSGNLQAHRRLCLTEQSEIEFINDIHLNKQCVEGLERYFKQHNSSGLSLIYLTQRLSFLGIQACKLGFETVVMATPIEHHSTIRHVAELNGCGSESLILTDVASLNSLELVADVLFCDIVEPYGAIGQQVLEDISFQRMTSLHADGLVLPCSIKIYGVFIESEELENLSHVTGNDKTLDFVIAEYINVFQMQNHVNIDLSNLSYNKSSEVFELLSLDLNDMSDESSSSLDQSVERSVAMTTSGKISALVYWFELKLADDLIVKTIDPRCHWRQAAIVMKEEIYGIAGQTLVTMVSLQNSCLGVRIVHPQIVNGSAH